MNLPFPGDQTQLTDDQENVMRLAEIAARTIIVWSKPDKARTSSDFMFMSWVNSK